MVEVQFFILLLTLTSTFGLDWVRVRSDAVMYMSELMVAYIKLSYFIVLFCYYYLFFKTYTRATVRLLSIVI